MDIRFENCYSIDKKLLREFARKYSIGPRPVISVITMALMVLSMPILVEGIRYGQDVTMMEIAYLVIILVQFLPRYYAWMVVRNTKKQNDGVLPETRVVFTEENIQMFEGMVHLTIEYRKIRRTVRLKNGYALFNGKRTAVLVKPDNFREGEFETFRAFIREKCPDIQIAK